MTATLTVSGNEITDASRTAALSWGTGQQGGSTDGATVPGGVAVWEAGTNLFRRGQCDATTDWSGASGHETISIDATTPGPFSPQSIKCVTDISSSNEGMLPQSATGQAAPAGTAAVGSIWFKGTAGQSYFTMMRWKNTDASVSDGVQQIFTATGQWQLLTPSTAAVVGTGKTGDALVIMARVNGTRADTFWLAHAMLQKGVNVVSPYIATSGGATATRAAGRVQAPASLLNATQGWFAMRLKLGWSSGGSGAGPSFPSFFEWADSTTNRILIYCSRSSGFLLIYRAASGSGATAQQAVSFNIGDIATIVGAWDSGHLYLSVNGSAFVSATNAFIPTITATQFDLGQGNSGAPGNWLDSSILWAACGTGTLTNTDAATLNALAANPNAPYYSLEDVNAVCHNAACTAVFPMTTTTYQNEAFTIIDPDGTGASRWMFPRLKVEIDATNAPTNATRVWTDVTADIRSLKYTLAGRNDELQQTQPGTLQVVFSNPTAKYDPTNGSGLGIKRRQWIRVRAQWAGVTYARWQGIITGIAQTWPQAGEDAIATVTASDALKVANLFDLYGQTFSSQRSDLRASTVGSLLGVTVTALDNGASTLVASSTPYAVNSPASQHLTEIETTENGLIYADSGGGITFHSRHYRALNKTTSVGTIGDGAGEIPYRDAAQVAVDDAYICNVAYVTPTNPDGSTGSVQSATDSASESRYFPSSPSQLQRTILSSDTNEALSCAQYLVNRYGDPSPRIPAVEIAGSRATSQWPAILGAANSTRFTFKRRAYNVISEDVFVEQISEEIVPNSAWKTTFQLSPAIDQAVWVLGSSVNSLLGQSTVVTY